MCDYSNILLTYTTFALRIITTVYKEKKLEHLYCHIFVVLFVLESEQVARLTIDILVLFTISYEKMSLLTESVLFRYCYIIQLQLT